jgi:hypothetical protein
VRSWKKFVAAGAAAASIVTLSAQAFADPPSGVTPKHTDIVGTGADVTQYVVDQQASDYDAGLSATARHWYSWDSAGSASIIEKNGCASRARPTATGSGLAELQANLRPSGDKTDYCVDYARASSNRATNGSPDTLLYLPFAIDGVTWSADTFGGATHAPTTLTPTQLAAIYTCDASILGTGKTGPVKWNEVGGSGQHAVIPVLPVSTSGTRKFFLQEIGVTTIGSCVQTGNNDILQSEGTNPIFQDASTAPDIVFPYSIADWLAQAQNGHNTGLEGDMILRRVSGVSPTTGKAPKAVLNANFPFLREIYNVVRNAAADPSSAQVVPKYLQPIFGNGTANSGWICKNATNKADIKSYGFLTTTRCGTIE